jgi:2-amino-4-hydroxy-6-hydroxymethyldihydropteridine diphosphokinase
MPEQNPSSNCHLEQPLSLDCHRERGAQRAVEGPSSSGLPQPSAPLASKIAAIALGSNLSSAFGDPAANLQEAIRRLGALGRVTAVSSFHATDPVGYLDQPQFLNAAALLATTLPPLDLLRSLLAIEHTMGRDRINAPPKGPRVIDLDLLLYADTVMTTPELMLPHPAMHQRAFVLAPLAEIAPAMQHPTLHRSIAELQAQLT